MDRLTFPIRFGKNKTKEFIARIQNRGIQIARVGRVSGQKDMGGGAGELHLLVSNIASRVR